MGRVMKDSGVEWIGEIPEEWNISPIKRSFDIYAGATPKTEVREYWDGDIIWITPADYKTDDKYVCSGRKNLSQTGYDSCGTTMIPAGSLIFSKRAPVGTVAINTKDLCTNQGCLSCVPKTSANTTFYYYATSIATKQFELVSSGTTFKEISADSFANFMLPEPPALTQNIIAEYLDSQCAKIIAVIEKTRSSIEEYKRLKQAVITQAVTKGVRGDRPMKDSGIAWVGKIPYSWGIKKAKYCVSISHGSDPLTEGETPVYGSGAESFKTCGEYKDGPCVLVGRKGATLHIPHYVEGRYWNVDTAFDCKKIGTFNIRYYYYCACSFDYKFYITQTTLPGMTQSAYNNMLLPLPTEEEQQEIVTYLDEKCIEIDALIAQKEQLLTELENYKKSLIYEYVTGKKEVPSQERLTCETIDPKVLLMVYIAEYFAPKGRVHMQKMIYSVECILGLPFGTQYYRYPHGPYDQNIEKYEQEAVYRGWLSVTTGNQVEYSIGNNVDEYRKAYQEAFGGMTEDIRRICTFLSKMKTSQTERVATLLASWNDFILKGIDSPTDDQIIDDVRNHWSDNKHNSPESTWQGTLDKIRSNGFAPKGNGLCTKS